jgi:hypothetical protein
MEEEFLGGTSDITKTEYSERKKYLEYVRNMDVDFLDTIYKKKLYGFVNNNYEVIAPTGDKILFGAYAGAISGLNYTVAMFNQFRQYYMEFVENNSALKVPNLIAGLKPTKSYISFDESYNEHIQAEAMLLSNFLRTTGHTGFYHFGDFVEILNSIIFEPALTQHRISKSGFALSEKSSVHHTGLYIDLGSDLNPQQDALKAELVMDPNFVCYAEGVQKFGFKVDFNCPWRIAVDINSSFARENILNGRPLGDFSNFYSDVYTVKVGYDDYWAVKSFYELMYLQYNRDIGTESVSMGFSNLQGPVWVKVLLLNRFKDLGLLDTRHQTSTLFEETLQKVNQVYQSQGLNTNTGAIAYINHFGAKTLKAIVESI